MVLEEDDVLEERKIPTFENIDTEGITEEQFIDLAAEKIGEIKKTENKLLEKQCFIKIFKYTGDLAKMRSKEHKKKA